MIKINHSLDESPYKDMLKQVNEYLDETFSDGATWAYRHPRWIDIRNERPQTDDLVLICQQDVVTLGYYHKYHWFYNNGRPAQPTHWMPLPAPPTVSEMETAALDRIMGNPMGDVDDLINSTKK